MTSPNPTRSDDSGMDYLPAALGVALLEQVSGGLFRSIGPLPHWLTLPDELSGDAAIDLAERFPLLELFLPSCAEVWDAGTPARIESDIWTEEDDSGTERYLQAVATGVGGRRLIVLQSLSQALFTYQQLAHDLELEKEKVERMSRDLVELNLELEKKRQEAERATRAKSDFLSSMSHEIRTPLNAIIGMADVLSSTQLTSEQRKCVDVSQRNGVGLLTLINDILDLSKVESGKVELEAVALDLREVIARAMEVIDVRTKAKGLTLSKTIASQVPVHLIGDPNRLRQVIINLLGNSVKFTHRGGLEVRVEPDSADSRPGSLRFAVSDTGIGIPEDKVGLVFESFTQADTSTTRKYGGTGLGLSISKQLVELMGGRIWAESRVGIGSTFFFTARFGVQEDQSDKQPNPHTSAADSDTSISGLRILLADDSDDNRFLILSYLKQVKPPIDIAENGEAAARMFRSGHYDVVLMDVEMPVMDGYAATREIRAFERETGREPTPVLALTAHAFADMADKSLEAGFTAHLTKPIRKATLLDALAKYANSPQSEPQSAESTAERIRVIVEKDMEDVVPAYLDKRRKDIETYREALGKGDLDTVRMMGHKLKGTGAGYGFERMTTIGAAIEKAALAGDAAEASARVVELARYIDSVQLEYSK